MPTYVQTGNRLDVVVLEEAHPPKVVGLMRHGDAAREMIPLPDPMALAEVIMKEHARTAAAAGSDFQKLRAEVKAALQLGLDAEAMDPAMGHLRGVTPKMVDWIASWLASERIGKVR